ncbi:protein bric-a-brac 1-like isoform X2 [Amphibalanus amphitrite]|uniref:protein bric-a-brac 1-like isoform X2 n=1 Tax=Amphibalanus amphitrite TaxID=1232801 RepID=UPI001C9071C1|nr:protein bric-a-brac 1-like isoform X2 [Amphibalanus amphitrite]
MFHLKARRVVVMGTEREYVLKWHSFSSTIQDVFRRLLDDCAFADVTLSVENRQLQCHRLVLSACSTYFETLLTAHPHSHPIIILHDIPHSVAQALIKFMYSGEIRLPQNQLQCFLKVAETLRIKGLTETSGKPKSAASPEHDSHGREPTGTDVAPIPPLIPAAAAASAVTPAARPAPAAAAAGSTAWAPAPAAPTKRRSPEPAHERDEPGTPPRESAKRRKSRAPAHAEPEPEQPEPEPLQLKVEPAEEPMEEPAEQPAEQPEQPEQEEAMVSPKPEPVSGDDEEPEAPEEDGEEEGEDSALSAQRRLEEDIELVSGETTQDGPPPAPTEPERRDTSPPAVPLTVQSASEAAASTLMDSCGTENAPWKDPRWSSLLPEEKVMEAMGNMLDVPTLAAKLMKNLFTEEERINSNTTGDHGKQIFDREKMDLIKSIVFHVSKVDREDQFARDDLWVRCKMKIDKWNRDLRYARKKKDKDTSLPTMVKLEYSSSGGRGDEDWERDGRERSDPPTAGVGLGWLGGLGSPRAVTPQCSADV